jgi:hypothetical protein
MNETRLANVGLHLPDGWVDITDDLPEGTPFTLARTDGFGALQFSIATYTSGPKPEVSMSALRDLLVEFGTARNLRGASNRTEWASDRSLGVTAEFSNEEDWIKAWYVTDGQNVALVTYIASLREPASSAEVAEAESIVRSMRW